jgi:hypothetical protein
MPNIYGPEQPWVDGDITENTIPIPSSNPVAVAGPDGTMPTEVTEGEGVCEGKETTTDTDVVRDTPSEAAGGTISKSLGTHPPAEGSPGSVNKAVTEQEVSEAVSGTVDTKISDDQVTEAESGITDNDVMVDAPVESGAGIINKELGLASSCNIV